MSDPKTLWRAELGTHADAKRGHSTLVWYGTVSACGRYVQQGEMLWQRNETWYESEAEALASLADRIAAIGLACLAQAEQLRAAQEAVT